MWNLKKWDLHIVNIVLGMSGCIACGIGDRLEGISFRNRGYFKNSYELLNLTALKFSPVNKIHSFQCMGKIFCMEFNDKIFMKLWNQRAVTVKSSWAFLKRFKFLTHSHKIHSIARPLGRVMGCILWTQTVIYTLPQSLQWSMQYHVTFDHVITALDCT